MNHSVLGQRWFSEPSGKEFAEALEMFLITYAEVILGFVFIVLLCAAGLALLEARQRRAARHAFTSRQPKRQATPCRQPLASGYELLRIEHDSIF